MDLLKLLKEEISSLNITDKLKIKDYIYFRTGELFNYDPLYLFGTEKEKNILYEKRIDIHNVNDFEIVCFTWAPLYADLLKEFDINAEVINNKEHAFVIATINSQKYLLDLMSDYEDLMRIKFGMQTLYNVKVDNIKEFLENKNNKLVNPITNTEYGLSKIKEHLLLSKNIMALKKENYVYLCYKTLEQILQSPKNNVGIVAGCKFIRNVIQYFNDYNYQSNITYFYDNDKKIYIKVYSIIDGEKKYFFASKMIDNLYNFNETNMEVIDYYLKNYNVTGLQNLSLRKN